MLEEVNKNTTPKHKAISEDKRDFKSPKHGDLFHQSRKNKLRGTKVEKEKPYTIPISI